MNALFPLPSNDTDAPLPLRGHHFLCLLAYVGAGYSEAFKENFKDVAAALGRGRPAHIITGHDRICHDESKAVFCPNMDKGRCLDAGRRDQRALRDLRVHIKPPSFPWAWEVGSTIVLDSPTVLSMREAFLSRALRSACAGCTWGSLCDRIAQGGFNGAVFYPEAIPPSPPSTKHFKNSMQHDEKEQYSNEPNTLTL